MEWPHDPDGDEGSEGRRKYGHAVIAKKIDEESDFPLTAGEFVEAHGDEPVRIDYERVVSVADVFEPIDPETTFESFPVLHQHVGQALRSQGYWPLELTHA